MEVNGLLCEARHERGLRAPDDPVESGKASWDVGGRLFPGGRRWITPLGCGRKTPGNPSRGLGASPLGVGRGNDPRQGFAYWSLGVAPD